MRLIFMGTPDFSVPALDALVRDGHEVLAVYSQPPRKSGRGKKERPGPVHLRALELGLEVRTPLSLKDRQVQADLQSLDADLAVVSAYGLILPPVVLSAPKLGCLNIHASLLPRWRGAAPIHRAIMAGDSVSGVCIMQMDEGLDTGPVLLRESTPIAANETSSDLHDRLSLIGADLVVRALENHASLAPVQQPEEGVTYASKIDKAEARIDWSEQASVIDRKIRGLSPFPGAWCTVGGERIKLLRSEYLDASAAPGTVLEGFTVACGGGAVRITEVQRAGKRPMAAQDALRGLVLPKSLI